MRFAVHHHQAKALPLQQALLAAGHELARDDVDVLLLDADFPAYRGLIDHYLAQGARVMLYPHGVPIALTHDGLYNPDPRVLGQFVVGEGQAEIFRRIGYPGELHRIGWFLTPRRPFRGSGRVRDVLFAPYHPMPDRGLEPLMRLNRIAFEQLLALDGIRLTVRHIRSLELNGLWKAPGVRYVEGKEDNAYGQIERADVVVAGYGTFPSLAVALGTPTVVVGGDLRVANYEHPDDLRYVANWPSYHEYLRYPLDSADGPLDELLHAAAESDAPIRAWRERFIGDAWDPAAFADHLVHVLSSPRLQARDFVTVAAAAEVLGDPRLLERYADTFSADDDATLVLLDDGDLDPTTFVARLKDLGVDPDDLPDTVLETGADAVERVAARAVAVLGEAPLPAALASLPRADVTNVGALRARALDRVNARAIRGADVGG